MYTIGVAYTLPNALLMECKHVGSYTCTMIITKTMPYD